MKVQPRRQMLDVWRAVVEGSVENRMWVFGGRHGRNSISDAEQLLCLMYPATEIDSFRLDDPDQIYEDVHAAFQTLGGSRTEVPRLLVRALTDYMETYRVDGVPTFVAEGYLRVGGAEPSDEQQRLEVVDAYSMSVTLSLSTLKFLKNFGAVVKRRDLLDSLDHLRGLASRRLTAAMVGLLRSFAVNVFEPYSDAGAYLRRTANQGNLPDSQLLNGLHSHLQDIRVGLRDLDTGVGRDIWENDLDDPRKLFECGWSWGVVEGAPPEMLLDATQVEQPPGIAVNRPHLYFTVVALDGIVDLTSERTRRLGLLDAEQQSLANSLEVRRSLTQQYWAKVATFDTGGLWPIEDIPWQTTDGRMSEYFSLLVTSMLTDEPRADSTRNEVEKLGEVLAALAARGRVTHRALPEDPALALHVTGPEIVLDGAECLGKPLSWAAPDYSAALLKRVLSLLQRKPDIDVRRRLTELADTAWRHLMERRISHGRSQDLWDRPDLVYPELATGDDAPSWYFTERVVECLVRAARLAMAEPPHDDVLADRTERLLAEAEHLLDHQLVLGNEMSPVLRSKLQHAQTKLDRARAIVGERPGTAGVLVDDVLRELDQLDEARSNAVRAT